MSEQVPDWRPTRRAAPTTCRRWRTTRSCAGYANDKIKTVTLRFSRPLCVVATVDTLADRGPREQQGRAVLPDALLADAQAAPVEGRRRRRVVTSRSSMATHLSWGVRETRPSTPRSRRLAACSGDGHQRRSKGSCGVSSMIRQRSTPTLSRRFRSLLQLRRSAAAAAFDDSTMRGSRRRTAWARCPRRASFYRRSRGRHESVLSTPSDVEENDLRALAT